MTALATTSVCPSCGARSTLTPGLPDVGTPCSFVALYDRATGDLARIVKPCPPTPPIGGAMGGRCDRCGPFVIGLAPLAPRGAGQPHRRSSAESRAPKAGTPAPTDCASSRLEWVEMPPGTAVTSLGGTGRARPKGKPERPS